MARLPSTDPRDDGSAPSAPDLARRDWPEARVFALGLTLAAGAALLLRSGAPQEAGAPRDERPAVAVSDATVARLRSARERESGVAPRSAAADRALREAAIDEEILYREALAQSDAGARDPAVKRRLVTLAGDLARGEVGEGTDLEADARRLGLDRNDVVLRRYLIESLRLALSRPGPGEGPSDADIERAYERSAARFTTPQRFALTQVYLSAQRRGNALEADATGLRDLLIANARPPETAVRLGDPFARGANVEGSAAELDRIFGDGFGRALEALPLQAWAGPIRSAYGLHLVWIRERIPGRRLPLDRVRGQVVQELIHEQGEALLRTRLAALRTRYRIELPDDVAR